jgi:hypothetical protein
VEAMLMFIYSFVDVAGMHALFSKILMDQLSSREASRFPLGFTNKT